MQCYCVHYILSIHHPVLIIGNDVCLSVCLSVLLSLSVCLSVIILIWALFYSLLNSLTHFCCTSPPQVSLSSITSSLCTSSCSQSTSDEECWYKRVSISTSNVTHCKHLLEENPPPINLRNIKFLFACNFPTKILY